MAINKAVTNTIADEAITSSKIEDGAITSGKISDDTTISVSKTPLGSLPPTISSLDTSQIDPASGATITITGTLFVSIPDVRFVNTTTGARITASSVGFTSSTTLTATFPANQTVGIYKVYVENPDGKAVLSSATITYSAAPLWSTAAGSLGSFEEGESVNVSLLAYDDDSTAVSSYSLQSGSLPSGITLSGDSSIGALTGTAPEVSADTAYNFTIRATDNESQTSDRAFSMTVTNWLVANSLRLNSGSSDYLNKTASAGDRRQTTISVWVKRGALGSQQKIYNHYNSTNSEFTFYFDSNDKFNVNSYESGHQLLLTTNRVFRDISAYYNIICAIDTDQATNTNRVKIYVNGVQETSFSTETYPSQNADLNLNRSTSYTDNIGRRGNGSEYFNGYLSEVYLIDGQQLTASSFGETDATSGIWIPKKYSGSYGTNGFFLKFANSGSLGTDSSGNGNNFTVNNLTSIDQTTDTPQNNFATMNPIAVSPSGTTGQPTFSEGNLAVTMTQDTFAMSTVGLSTGKWYFEYKLTENISDNQDYPIVGINTSGIGSAGDTIGFRTPSGTNYRGQLGTTSVDNAFLSSRFAGDLFGFYIDLDNSTLIIHKNGSTYMASGYTNGLNWSGGLTTSNTQTGFYFPYVQSNGVGTFTDYFNFGNPPFSISSGNADANGYGNFEYSPTLNGVDYLAICTKNLATNG